MRHWPALLGLALAIAFAAGPLAAQTDLAALAHRAQVKYTDVPRKVLAFYYPWYGNAEVPGGSGRWSHWSGVDTAAKQIGSSTNYPVLGPYDSHDPKLIARHAEWSKQAGLDGWIVSWWGRRDFSGRAMRPILDACKAAGLEATIYYETVPRRDPDAAVKEILDVLNRYGKHPAWLRLNGRPVIFVYGRAVQEIGLRGWLSVVAEVNRRYPGGAAIIGDQISRAAARVFDGVHTYNTCGSLRGKDLAAIRRWAAATYPGWVKTAADPGRVSTLTVIPGYDDTKIRKPGLKAERLEGRSYQAQWEAAIAAAPDWVLVTSFNEWHEGSEIEPSAEDGEKYLKLTAEMAARFKKAPPRKASPKQPQRPKLTEGQQAALAKLRNVPVGLLPDADLDLVWSLLALGIRPRALTWQQTAELQAESAKGLPLLVYAGGEMYQPTARQPGDVIDGLRRYLEGGGLLVVLPSGPMPMHYDHERRGVDGARRIGLPLSVGGSHGGWEQPPEGKTLEMVRVGDRLPNLPRKFPFPDADPRWRPLVRAELAEGDLVVPLLELRDTGGTSYGDAAVYLEHRQSEPKGARILYAWFGLMRSPQADDLLPGLLAFAAEKIAPH